MSAALGARDVVVRYLLERNAATRADEVLVTFEDGGTWSCAEALDEAYRAANVLHGLGIRQDDRVAIFMPNGRDFFRAWWGTVCLGATMVAVNTAYKGSMLSHVFDVVEATVVVSEGELMARCATVSNAPKTLEAAELAGADGSAPPLDRPIEAWDTHCVTMTSGTTGPSKASLTSYTQLYLTGCFMSVDLHLGDGDVALIDLPLFHQAGLSLCTAIMSTTAALAVRRMPDLRNYWKVAKETRATVAFVVSTMASYLLSLEPGPHERDHQLKYLVMSPPPLDARTVLERFGVADFVTGYGMTELSNCIARLPGQETVAGSMGYCRDGYELRLVDAHDMEVPVGEIGQLVVRTEHPWWISHGYIGNAEATASAWRNGWFHTGDLMRRDEAGNYFFHDRIKDAVRRRGENISSFEVEREVVTHPGVAEVACVPVTVTGEVDEEVKVWIVPAGTEPIVFEDLVGFLAARMPHFMVPRFYELIDALPKTESMKVRKADLRKLGNSAETWDLTAQGLRVSRAGEYRR